MIPLTLAPGGEELKIVRISGRDQVCRHLSELGFVPDATVTIVSEISGNMILSLKSSRVALDKRMTDKIMVERKI